MRRLITTLFVAIVVQACGSEPQCFKNRFYSEFQVGPHTDTKDPALEPYIVDFVNDFRGLVPDRYLNYDNLYSYRYESLPDETVGQCITWTTGKREMLIAPQLYNMNESQKAVIYHELGHCLFGLDHDYTELHSLMSEYVIISDLYWKANWAEQLQKFKDFALPQVK